MKTPTESINNEIYESLGEKWFLADDDPVALLRAENRFRNPWVIGKLKEHGIFPGARVLDLGCGAGFLTQDLQKAGYHATGIDAADGALAQARKHDPSGQIHYMHGDILNLPTFERPFDACFLMDVLEHVENPDRALFEASRVLKPGGLCIFYTFNRNWLSKWLVIKGVETFVANTPKNLHVYKLFLTPAELTRDARQAGLTMLEWQGMGPRIFQPAMWTLLRTKKVRSDFVFEKKPNLWVGMIGISRKTGAML